MFFQATQVVVSVTSVWMLWATATVTVVRVGPKAAAAHTHSDAQHSANRRSFRSFARGGV